MPLGLHNQNTGIAQAHETPFLPNCLQIPENCTAGADCMPMVISWEGTTEIQSGDVLIVEIDDSLLVPDDNRTDKGETKYVISRFGADSVAMRCADLCSSARCSLAGRIRRSEELGVRDLLSKTAFRTVCQALHLP